MSPDKKTVISTRGCLSVQHNQSIVPDEEVTKQLRGENCPPRKTVQSRNLVTMQCLDNKAYSSKEALRNKIAKVSSKNNLMDKGERRGETFCQPPPRRSSPITRSLPIAAQPMISWRVLCAPAIRVSTLPAGAMIALQR